ncbi:hypothetical protein CYMTET_21445 [Cymbomonas tetramitiformis]|uniref:GIY-YIG domain-containing protein n=1 Tax=Cymbomonas tetramitiformis TaxID=36881 RepID=A0AAE0G254_9CHLO|nr:hypothetical protein CYMTET_21445 [Cymbomonas tetramitiformis]
MEGVVAGDEEDRWKAKRAVRFSMFGSLVMLQWVGMQPRWWLKQYLPWWNALGVEELQDWYSGRARYGTYVLASVESGRTYVGKFWSGPKERLTEHIVVAMDPSARGGRRLYGGLRARGVHKFFMLPLKTYLSKGECDADEKAIIRRTQKPGRTLNTVGVRSRRKSEQWRRYRAAKRRRRRLELGTRRRSMWQRACHVAKGRIYGACSGYTRVEAAGYCGHGLHRALDRLSKKTRPPSGTWDVEFKLGSWDTTDWARLKLKYGRSEVIFSNSSRELRGTLRAVIPLLRRENAKLRFSAIEVSETDAWAEKFVRDLVRRPAVTWKLVPRLVLDRVIRLWQSAPAAAPEKAAVKIRASLRAVAKKAHDFLIRGTYIFKACLPRAMPSAAVRRFLLQCVDSKTTELSGRFAELNRSLKDTPVADADNNDVLLQSTTEFLKQFTHFDTVSSDAIRQLLPWRCVVDGRDLQLVENDCNGISFVALCGHSGLLVQIRWQRFIFLMQRLDAYGTATEQRKRPVLELQLLLVSRLLAWASLVTQDYWITPYSKQDALRFCFSLIDELFASPLDVNVNSEVFCTPYPEDVCFGAICNAFSIVWHLCALGNPIYTIAHIRKCISHALLSARSTRKPVRLVFVVPYWQKWDETEGVELVCLLKKKKFSFLAPQSALGFKDRSKSAKFDVAILLIQNTTLMKGGISAGMLLQQSGGTLSRELCQAATRDAECSGRLPPLSRFRELTLELDGLARGVLDRNVAVGFGVCLKVYQDWLRQERDGGNYTMVHEEGAEVIRQMKLRYSSAGLDRVATFSLGGWFGVLYLMLKHKDGSLWEKRRPVVPGFRAPDRMLQNRVGRVLCFLIAQLSGHFNVAATQQIVGRIKDFNRAVRAGDTVMAASFDVKEMYVRLRHPQVLRAAEFVVTAASRGRSGVSVRTRGRKGVSWFEPGTPRGVAVQMTEQQVLAGVRYILENGYLIVAGNLMRQTCGIGIGGNASPGLAQCVCVFGEMEWTSSLGADRRLTGTRVQGIRLMDDCTLLVTRDCGGDALKLRELSAVFRGYMNECYCEGVTVELTSEGLEWTFCGMSLQVSRQGVSARMLMKNVREGVKAGMQLQFFPLVAFESDCGKTQKMASTLNALYRIDRHCTSDVLKLAALMDLRRELNWQGYPRSWLGDALARMVSRIPLDFWERLHRKTERLGVWI